MSLLEEYINKKLGPTDLTKELQRLIAEYNKIRGTYLFVYSTAVEKPIPEIYLMQSDFYVIRDLLSDKSNYRNIDMYIETRGGSGETAEEIVKFLHNNFKKVSFVVAGEAKSAGTILVLGGDEILMTETGSLGPIDAQTKIGRSTISAYDYIEWVNEKRVEAEKVGKLNPFDATMIAQISPGELKNVFHALNYSKDLVIEWLPKYKFREWTTTETNNKPVTEEMKKDRAREIADILTKHSDWRTHGRSLKINDLENIVKLKIINIDKMTNLSEIVYRIKTVCSMLFDSTTNFKIFATKDTKIFRSATSPLHPPKIMQIPVPDKSKIDVANIEQKCPQCGTIHRLFGKFRPNPKIDEDMKNRGFQPLPADAKLLCVCGFEIDLSGVKNQLEMQIGKKLL